MNSTLPPRGRFLSGLVPQGGTGLDGAHLQQKTFIEVHLLENLCCPLYLVPINALDIEGIFPTLGCHSYGAAVEFNRFEQVEIFVQEVVVGNAHTSFSPVQNKFVLRHAQ
jgi:hypothetical protein